MLVLVYDVFVFKQKTAYEMRISDWSSDVCSSDLKTVTVDTDWDTPPDNTSVYSMPAQVVYAPVSGGFESAHVYFYIDDALHKLSAARGPVSVACTKEAMPQIQFSFPALRVPAAAGPNPTHAFIGFVEPPPHHATHTPDT